jgi:hypothetical protein
MIEYFLESVFEGIREYWVNTKSLHIPSFRDKNTEEVNKP